MIELGAEIFPVRFVKMHGLGNDFVLINMLGKPFSLTREKISHLANRYLGIGFDQMLIISSSKQADFFCRIFNADGSEAEQCGNGLRCAARFLHEEKIIHREAFQIETKAGIFPLVIQDYDHIQITLGTPHVQEKLLSLSLPSGLTVPVSIISVGNPHAIIDIDILKADSLKAISTTELGKEIAAHAFFADGANVGFMQILDSARIRLRTFERGVGETYACGSNACAAVVAGIIQKRLQNKVHVELQYGSLIIEWKEDKRIYLTGPATRVFSGEIV